jgi:hypothetical protein
MVVSMLDTQMLHMTALRHTQGYERSLYLAEAGIRHALASMQYSGESFAPFHIGPIEFPEGSGNTYEVDAVKIDFDIVVTASGTSGDITRYLSVTVNAD